jgi:hypothetical protein
MSCGSKDGHLEKGKAFVMTKDNRAFQLYKEKASQFTKIFSGVIITSLFIFSVILLPYVLAVSKYYETDRDYVDARNIAEAYVQISDNLKQVRLTVATFPDAIINMSKSFNNFTSSNVVTALYCRSGLPDIDQWKKCRLEAMIEDKRVDTKQKVDETVEAFGSLWRDENYIKYYQRIANSNNDKDSVQIRDLVDYPELLVLYAINPSKLKSNIDQTYDNYKVLSDQLNLWNSSDAVDKEEYDRLRNEALSFLSNNQGLFALQLDAEYTGVSSLPSLLQGESLSSSSQSELDIAQGIVDRFTKFQSIVRELERVKLEAVSEVNDIRDTLEDFESPFGKLPLGFSQIIIIFPFGLAIGSLVSFRMLYEAKKFRDKAFTFDNPPNSSDSTCKEEYIKTAPLWYETTKGWKKQKFQIPLLLIPGVIFVASVILIVYGWLLIPTEFSADFENEFTLAIYFTLYVLSWILICYCYWLIFVKMQRNSPEEQ